VGLAVTRSICSCAATSRRRLARRTAPTRWSRRRWPPSSGPSPVRAAQFRSSRAQESRSSPAVGSSAEELTTPGVYVLTGGYPATLGAFALDAKQRGLKKFAMLVTDVSGRNPSGAGHRGHGVQECQRRTCCDPRDTGNSRSDPADAGRGFPGRGRSRGDGRTSRSARRS